MLELDGAAQASRWRIFKRTCRARTRPRRLSSRSRRRRPRRCAPCDDNDADDGGVLTLTAAPAADADTKSRRRIQTSTRGGSRRFLQKLALSLVAARQLGWLTVQLATLQRHMSSVAAYDFVLEVKTWPRTSLPLWHASAPFSNQTHANVKTALKKLTKQHGLAMATVTQALDACLVRPRRLAHDPWERRCVGKTPAAGAADEALGPGPSTASSSSPTALDTATSYGIVVCR